MRRSAVCALGVPHMENHRSTPTVDRPGRGRLVPWESLESHAPTAFTVAGLSLLASLVVPFALLVVTDRPWLVGIALVGVAVLTAALGLLGLHRRASVDSPTVAVAGAAFATTAGVASLVVLAVAGVALPRPDVAFSVGKTGFVVLSLTMAAGYALGFLAYGIGLLRSNASPNRVGVLLTAGGLLLVVPVVAGVLQLGTSLVLPAWVVFPTLGLVAVDTVAVGHSLRPTN